LTLRLRFLLDTNILIPLQDSMAVLQPSLTNFARLCNAHGHQLLYHPASIEDIRRDANADRRNRTLARIGQYTQLQAGPACPWNGPTTSENDACDNEILYALERNAAHALVTEDQRLHRKARARNLSDRVYFIQSADDWLRRLHEPGEALLPNIDDVELHTLTDQLAGPFFDSIRADYVGFNDWLRRKAMEDDERGFIVTAQSKLFQLFVSMQFNTMKRSRTPATFSPAMHSNYVRSRSVTRCAGARSGNFSCVQLFNMRRTTDANRFFCTRTIHNKKT